MRQFAQTQKTQRGININQMDDRQFISNNKKIIKTGFTHVINFVFTNIPFYCVNKMLAVIIRTNKND